MSGQETTMEWNVDLYRVAGATQRWSDDAGTSFDDEMVDGGHLVVEGERVADALAAISAALPTPFPAGATAVRRGGYPTTTVDGAAIYLVHGDIVGADGSRVGAFRAIRPMQRRAPAA